MGEEVKYNWFQRKILGKRIEITGDSEMSTRIETRSRKAAAAQKNHDAELKALADEARRKAKQAEIDSLLGGSGRQQDPNAGLFGFMRNILGGGRTGNDASKMVITLKAEDVVEEGSTQTDPSVLREWLRRSARSKSQSVYKSALELPQNQDVKSKLMNNKPK